MHLEAERRRIAEERHKLEEQRRIAAEHAACKHKKKHGLKKFKF